MMPTTMGVLCSSKQQWVIPTLEIKEAAVRCLPEWFYEESFTAYMSKIDLALVVS